MSRLPQPGEPAPPFEGVCADGRHVSLADFRGRKLVLYFYPRDDTPGCTRQACSLRDGMQALTARGAAILGVSAQGVESHRAFASKFGLGFPLLADPYGRVGRAYGVLGGSPLGWLRALAGFARRVTFVIDEQGRIAHVIERPDVKRHADEVMALL
jgi:peroxiredoxin Q/BCP